MKVWKILLQRRSQHDWAKIKELLIIPDECFIVIRLRLRSAQDRGQKDTFWKIHSTTLSEGCLWKRGGRHRWKSWKSGKMSLWMMSQFGSPASDPLNSYRLMSTRCVMIPSIFSISSMGESVWINEAAAHNWCSAVKHANLPPCLSAAFVCHNRSLYLPHVCWCKWHEGGGGGGSMANVQFSNCKWKMIMSGWFKLFGRAHTQTLTGACGK